MLLRRNSTCDVNKLLLFTVGLKLSEEDYDEYPLRYIDAFEPTIEGKHVYTPRFLINEDVGVYGYFKRISEIHVTEQRSLNSEGKFDSSQSLTKLVMPLSMKDRIFVRDQMKAMRPNVVRPMINCITLYTCDEIENKDGSIEFKNIEASDIGVCQIDPIYLDVEDLCDVDITFELEVHDTIFTEEELV